MTFLWSFSLFFFLISTSVIFSLSSPALNHSFIISSSSKHFQIFHEVCFLLVQFRCLFYPFSRLLFFLSYVAIVSFYLLSGKGPDSWPSFSSYIFAVSVLLPPPFSLHFRLLFVAVHVDLLRVFPPLHFFFQLSTFLSSSSLPQSFPQPFLLVFITKLSSHISTFHSSRKFSKNISSIFSLHFHSSPSSNSPLSTITLLYLTHSFPIPPLPPPPPLSRPSLYLHPSSFIPLSSFTLSLYSPPPSFTPSYCPTHPLSLSLSILFLLPKSLPPFLRPSLHLHLPPLPLGTVPSWVQTVFTLGGGRPWLHHQATLPARCSTLGNYSGCVQLGHWAANINRWWRRRRPAHDPHQHLINNFLTKTALELTAFLGYKDFQRKK